MNETEQLLIARYITLYERSVVLNFIFRLKTVGILEANNLKADNDCCLA